MKLDKMDEMIFRGIWVDLWKQRAEIGPQFYLDVVERFLIKKGYKIVPKDPLRDRKD